MRAQLLVSVRNAEEASAALRGGADIIDIKEPTRGALGAADPEQWQAVLREVAGRVPVSAALGELIEEPVRDRAARTAGLAWAKVGLRNVAAHADWQSRWRDAMACLPRSVQPVAVAYADWQHANAPPPNEVLDLAIAADCHLLLLDTCFKTGASLFDFLSEQAVAHLCAQAHRARVRIALAGSLRIDSLPTALQCGADIVAVRGAACNGGREDSIDERLVAALSSIVRSASAERDAPFSAFA